MNWQPEPIEIERPRLNGRKNALYYLWRGLVDLTQMFLLAFAVYILVNLALPRYAVEGRSMQPIFNGEGNERVIVNRLEYLITDPQRGDIVVIENPDDPQMYYIKRVVGLPGETVSMSNGQVLINGIALDEPYVLALCSSARCDNRVWELGATDYFVLGDNRNASHDSVNFGAISRDKIVGRAWIHYWPPEEWKFFRHHDYQNPALLLP